MRFDLAFPCGHVSAVRDAFFESEDFGASQIVDCTTCSRSFLAIELGHEPWVLLAYLPRSRGIPRGWAGAAEATESAALDDAERESGAHAARREPRPRTS